MVGSLSSGSSGPRPVISSRISETKSLSSCVLSAQALDQRCIARRAAGRAGASRSSGSFSSADRLISSISRRCRRTLASSSLSLSSGFRGCSAARPARLLDPAARVQDHAFELAATAALPALAVRPVRHATSGETADHGCSPHQSRSLQLLQQRHCLPSPAWLRPAQISFLELGVILLPGLTSSSGTPRSIASRTSA